MRDRDRERAREWLTRKECEHQCFHDGGASLESLTDLLAEARAQAESEWRGKTVHECGWCGYSQTGAEGMNEHTLACPKNTQQQEIASMRPVVEAALRYGKSWDDWNHRDDEHEDSDYSVINLEMDIADDELQRAVAEYRRQHPTEDA